MVVEIDRPIQLAHAFIDHSESTNPECSETSEKSANKPSPRRRLMPAKAETPLRKAHIGECSQKIHLPSIAAVMSSKPYIEIAAKFMQKFEALGKKSLEFSEENIERTKKLLHELLFEFKENERAMAESAEGSRTWETIGHITSGVVSIASIAIGATLIATGNPLSILAGVAMIISGMISISCTILERTGTQNDITLGFQIAGGVIGLIGGGIALGTGSGSMELAIKIGLGLITGAAHGSKAASYIHQQNGLKEEADSDRLQADLTVNKDGLEKAAKLLTFLDEKMLENTVNIILALQQEEDVLRRFVEIQPTRG